VKLVAIDELKEKLKRRPTFFLRQPLLAELNPSVHGIDSDVDALIEAKKKEWQEKGYTENQIRMAIDLATEWAYSMSNAFAPPELRSTVFKHNLKKGFDVADKWLKGLLASIL
jgi:hypothetical protein